jgi:hypothetical protein
MSTRSSIDDLFERRVIYPDFEPQERLARLVGLDEHKARLTNILSLLVNPAGLDAWSKKYHGSTCALSFSRIAQRSLALRPAHSRCHQFVTR